MVKKTRAQKDLEQQKRGYPKLVVESSCKKKDSTDELLAFLNDMETDPERIANIEKENRKLHQRIEELTPKTNYHVEMAPECVNFRYIPLIFDSESAETITGGKVREVCRVSGVPTLLGVLMPHYLDLNDLFILNTDNALFEGLPRNSNVIISKTTKPRPGDYVLSDEMNHLNVYVYEKDENGIHVLYDELMDCRRSVSSLLGVVIGKVDINLKFNPRSRD